VTCASGMPTSARGRGARDAGEEVLSAHAGIDDDRDGAEPEERKDGGDERQTLAHHHEGAVAASDAGGGEAGTPGADLNVELREAEREVINRPGGGAAAGNLEGGRGGPGGGHEREMTRDVGVGGGRRHDAKGSRKDAEAQRKTRRQATTPRLGQAVESQKLVPIRARQKTGRLFRWRERGDVAEQVGLPWEQEVVELVGCAGDLREHGAVCDQRGLDAKFFRNGVAVGLDAVLQLDLGLRERNVVGIAARAARERLRVAGQAGVQGLGERRKKAGVALTEVHAVQDGFLGVALLGGLGDLDEEGVAADFERRGVEALGLRLAPVPDGVEHAQAGPAEAFAAADAPVDVGGGGETGGAGLDLRAALLVEPVEAPKLGEFPW